MYMKKGKPVRKIPIFTWCIFGVLQFTSLPSIDCLTSIDIKRGKLPHVDDITAMVNGFSEKHSGRVEKGSHNFCKKSPFGFYFIWNKFSRS